MKAPIGKLTKEILKDPAATKRMMDALLSRGEKREFEFKGETYKIVKLGEESNEIKDQK